MTTGVVAVFVLMVCSVPLLLQRRLIYSDAKLLTNHRPCRDLPIRASIPHTSVLVLRRIKKNSPLQGLLNVNFVFLICFIAVM